MLVQRPKPLALQLAQASWVAPLLALLINILLRNVSGGAGQSARDITVTAVSVGLYLIGFACAIVALLSIHRHGRKGILAPALVGLTLSGALLTFAILVFRGSVAEAASPQARLERTAAQINEGLPQEIDENTSIDRVTAGEGELVYHYSLPSYRSDELDGARFAQIMKPDLVGQFCEPMEMLWASGFALRLRYTGSDGGLVAEIAITGDDCGAPQPPS